MRVPPSLAPCPDHPNCVSSQATNRHHRIPPFVCGSSCEKTLQRLRRLIEADSGARLAAEAPGYLRAEYRSAILRFVDDLELLIDPTAGVVHVRSAARTGSWDFGVNRRRVENLRRRLANSRP